MSINPTVPHKTALYPSVWQGAAPPMDKAWQGFFDSCAQAIVRTKDHDTLLAILLARPKAKLPTIIKGTHSQRNAQAPVNDFSLWYETDRNVWYMAVSGVWNYWLGTMLDVLANVPTDLDNTHDTGFQFGATDYKHEWYWASSQYNFQPWEQSGQIVASATGSAPNGGSWQACDGSSVNIAKATGTSAATLVQSVTTPNLTGNVYIMGGTDARTAAAAMTSQTINFNYQTGVTNFNMVVPQDLAPSDANGGVPLRIGLSFYVRR